MKIDVLNFFMEYFFIGAGFGTGILMRTLMKKIKIPVNN
jgi:hypothetical protein